MKTSFSTGSLTDPQFPLISHYSPSLSLSSPCTGEELSVVDNAQKMALSFQKKPLSRVLT
jgi:hypothetical protein